MSKAGHDGNLGTGKGFHRDFGKKLSPAHLAAV